MYAAHSVDHRELEPGDEIKIAFRCGVVTGRITEGRVTVHSVGDHVIRVLWPNDDVPWTYNISALLRLEKI